MVSRCWTTRTHILVPGGFGNRGTRGMMKAAQVARERGIPYFGICYGFQWATVEYARNVAGLADADSTECNPDTATKVIYKLRDLLVSTTWVGRCDWVATPASSRQALSRSGCTEPIRRRSVIATVTSSTVSTNARSPNTAFAFRGVLRMENSSRFAELPLHPWYLAVQFHPEFRSKPLRPHPLFASFVEASHRHKLGQVPQRAETESVA